MVSKMGLRAITDIERKNINMIHTELGEAWKLEEDTEVSITDSIVLVVEYLGYDASTLTYDEASEIVSKAQNVWHNYRLVGKHYLILGGKQNVKIQM